MTRMLITEDAHPGAKYVVCPVCAGEGFTSKLGAFTAADLDEWFEGDVDDREDFRAEYSRRGGAYDERCQACKGQRVMTPDEVAAYEDLARMEAEQRAEMRYAG